MKTDANGVKQWDKRFGGPLNDLCTDLALTRDGGCILGGVCDSGAGGDKSQGSRGGYDYWVVKVSSSGAKQWDKRFGGPDDDMQSSVLQTSDGGYILGGSSRSGAGGDKSQASQGGRDMWVVKVSATGAKQWDRRFGGSQDEGLSRVRQTAEGGYLFGGTSESPAGGDKTEGTRGFDDFWVVKVNGNGAKQWDRRFGGAAGDSFSAVCQTLEGGYLLAGRSSSGAGGDKTEDCRGGSDMWAVRLAVPDAFESDNGFGSSKTIRNGVVQNRSIHSAGNEDWAKFTVGPGGARNIQIVSTLDTQLWLLRDSDGATLGYDNPAINGFADGAVVELASLTAGIYYIKVMKFNSGVLPEYQLTARWRQVVLRDAYENDNRRSAAKRIRNGRTQNRTIHRPGNRDWAKFTIGERGAQNVKIQTAGASGDTQLWLYDAAGRRLKFDDDSGRGRFSRIRRSSLAAGTYFIRVQENGNNERIPAYTLRATWTDR